MCYNSLALVLQKNKHSRPQYCVLLTHACVYISNELVSKCDTQSSVDIWFNKNSCVK